MPTEIPDLWGDDIKVDVLSPLLILKAQDEAIRRKTQGVLRANVVTTEVNPFEELEYDEDEDEDEDIDADDGALRPNQLVHALDLGSPVIAYTETLLQVSHAVNRAYPAKLSVPDPLRWDLERDPPNANDSAEDLFSAARSSIIAYSADELLRHLRRALQSRDTRAAIDSLLALANEARSKTGPKS